MRKPPLLRNLGELRRGWNRKAADGTRRRRGGPEETARETCGWGQGPSKIMGSAAKRRVSKIVLPIAAGTMSRAGRDPLGTHRHSARHWSNGPWPLALPSRAPPGWEGCRPSFPPGHCRKGHW